MIKLRERWRTEAKGLAVVLAVAGCALLAHAWWTVLELSADPDGVVARRCGKYSDEQYGVCAEKILGQSPWALQVPWFLVGVLLVTVGVILFEMLRRMDH